MPLKKLGFPGKNPFAGLFIPSLPSPYCYTADQNNLSSIFNFRKMKSFINKIFLFGLLVVGLFLLILSLADGYTDPFYKRFTSPQQDNLILGTSRSAQGLLPHVLKNILKKDFFNYSFTVSHSPYGPVYLNSIQKKLDPKARNGVFILAVDPWAIASQTDQPNDSLHFRENNLCLGNTHFVNINPNFEYLLKNLSGNYYTVISNRKKNVFLHDNGWLEVSVTMDSSEVAKRKADKIIDYRNNLIPYYKPSSLRIIYLQKTISFLQEHGKVYLVRLPTHPEMYALENEWMPDFNERIANAANMADGFLDLSFKNASFLYTDGNHLHKSSGKIVSNRVANWIKNNY